MLLFTNFFCILHLTSNVCIFTFNLSTPPEIGLPRQPYIYAGIEGSEIKFLFVLVYRPNWLYRKTTLASNCMEKLNARLKYSSNSILYHYSNYCFVIIDTYLMLCYHKYLSRRTAACYLVF